MTRLRSTRAATTLGDIVLQASVRLMDDYLDTASVGSMKSMAVLQPATGPYGLIMSDPTGAVRYLRQAVSADSGWVEEPLGTEIVAERQIGIADAQGNIFVFARASDVTDATLHYATRNASGWSPWTAIPPDENTPAETTVPNLLAVNDAGTIRLFAILQSEDGAAIWEVSWSDPIAQWSRLADAEPFILQAAALSIIGAPPGQSLIFTKASEGAAGLHDIIALPLAGGASPVVLAPDMPFTAMTVAMRSGGQSAVFIANDGAIGDAAVQYLDGSAPANGFTVIYSGAPVTALAATDGRVAPVTLFAIDAKGVLRVIADPTDPVQGDDFQFSAGCSGILTAVDRDGNPELVARFVNDGLSRLWSNPPEGPQSRRSWSHAPIEYSPQNRALSQVCTYAATLTFFDAKGLPIPNTPVELFASEVAPARIGSQRVLLGPTKAVALITDAAGRCRVTLPTESINCPVLSARLAATMTDGGFSIVPDNHVRQNLAKISVADVQKLVAEPYKQDAAAIQNMIQQSILLTAPADQVVRFVAAGGERFATPIRGDAHRLGAHAFRVVGGRAHFESLDPAAARQRIDALVPAEPDDIFDDFDDLMEEVGDAINDSAHYLYEHVLTPVSDGFDIAIHFAAAGLEVAWKGLVETVEDAFRFIETALASVGAFFENLYNFLAWLLSDALEEIRATKSQFDAMVDCGMVGLKNWSSSAGGSIATFFQMIESQIMLSIEEAMRLVGTEDPNQAIDQEAPPNPQSRQMLLGGLDETFLEVIEDGGAVSNWLFDRVAEILGIDFDASFPREMLDAAQSMIEKVVAALVDTLQDSFNSLVTNLQKLATDVTDFGNVLLSTLLDLAKTLVIDVMNLLAQLAEEFVAFFAEYLPNFVDAVFGAAIGNDLLGLLYDLIVPDEDPTVLRLGTLLAAFVVTIGYRLIFDEAPFGTSKAGEVTLSQAGVFTIIAGIAQSSLWLMTDLELDLVGPGDMKWQYFGVTLLMPLLIQLAVQPGGPFTDMPVPFPDDGTEAKWKAWFAGFAGIGFKAIWGVLMLVGVREKGPRGSIDGAIGLGACGALALGTNVYAAAISGAPASTWISGIASPLSSMAKWAKFTVDPVDARIIMGVVDVISDAGGGIAKIVRGTEMHTETALSVTHGRLV